MIIILSPTKTFTNNKVITTSKTPLEKETNYLVNILNKLSLDQLKDKLRISSNLANTVYNYYKNFNAKYYPIYLYGGTAFKYLDPKNIPEDQLKKVYILSALYGLINAFDGISMYRLDIKDKILDPSLYDYWYDHINKELNNLNQELIINLSSGEYSKLLDLSNEKIVTINFATKINNKLVSQSMLLKKMRGTMTNYILVNNTKTIDEIKKIVIDDFKYNKDYSNDNLLMFIKDI